MDGDDADMDDESDDPDDSDDEDHGGGDTHRIAITQCRSTVVVVVAGESFGAR